jgi:putative transposase
MLCRQVSAGKVCLKVSRQRKDHAIKLARCVITSNDVVAYEDLRIKNLVRNHCLAKSISDAGWYQFRVWLEYFGKVFGRITIAVNPAYKHKSGKLSIFELWFFGLP